MLGRSHWRVLLRLPWYCLCGIDLLECHGCVAYNIWFDLPDRLGLCYRYRVCHHYLCPDQWWAFQSGDHDLFCYLAGVSIQDLKHPFRMSEPGVICCKDALTSDIRFPWKKVPHYILSQIFGAFIAGCLMIGCYWPEIQVSSPMNIRDYSAIRLDQIQPTPTTTSRFPTPQ